MVNIVSHLKALTTKHDLTVSSGAEFIFVTAGTGATTATTKAIVKLSCKPPIDLLVFSPILVSVR